MVVRSGPALRTSVNSHFETAIIAGFCIILFFPAVPYYIRGTGKVVLAKVLIHLGICS
jgi:hypothetical protein